MAVQERNSEMVNLLKADFVSKEESIYAFTAYQNLLNGLPGLIGLWTMGGINSTNVLHSGFKTTFDAKNDILGLGTVDPTAGGTLVSAMTVAQADNNTAIAVVDKTTNVGRMAINGEPAGGFQMYDRGSGSWALGIAQRAGDLYLNGKLGGPWTLLPYTNSGGTTWTDYDTSSWAIGAYRIFGDMIFLKGLVKRTAGGSFVIANLPAACRPLRYHLFSVITDTGPGRLDIGTGGDMTLVSGGTTWVSLALPPYSIYA